jgi:hypothetical protein
MNEASRFTITITRLDGFQSLMVGDNIKLAPDQFVLPFHEGFNYGKGFMFTKAQLSLAQKGLAQLGPQLPPQEAIAQYGNVFHKAYIAIVTDIFSIPAGNDPNKATPAWLDCCFGMGAEVQDMIPGYDCLHEAVYLPATTHSEISSIMREYSICIFEHDTECLLTRHVGLLYGESRAVKGYVLIIRTISTVGKCGSCLWYNRLTLS